MIDLEAMARAFVRPAIEVTKWNMNNGLDKKVLEAVENKNLDNPYRISTLQRWLTAYAVFQGFTNDNRNEVVEQILAFANTRGCHLLSMSEDTVIDYFNDLHSRCGVVVKNNKNGKPKKMTSLTSKALWCCYPNAVPIYDRLAQNALWLIAKLIEADPPQEASGYKSFVQVWFKIYRKVESIITEEADRIGYPYKVRVFDRMLWIIGQPNYTGEIRLGSVQSLD